MLHRVIAKVEVGERNSFQTHIIYKDSDTFEVIRAATEVLGMLCKLKINFEVFQSMFPYSPVFMFVTYMVYNYYHHII